MYNETTLSDGELVEYAKTASGTGLTITVDPVGLSFRSFGDVVLGYPSCLEERDVEHVLFGVFHKVRVYPEWLLEMAGGRKYSGTHTVILVSGEERFELRQTVSNYANLIMNTGKEDVYVSKGRFDIELDGDGIFVSTGEDFTENLRRVYAMVLHTDDRGVKRYENLTGYVFNGSERIRGILIEMNERGLEVEIFGEVFGILLDELVDLRVPKELCWAMKGLGG